MTTLKSKVGEKVTQNKNYYDRFIRQALNYGFTDEQADFIWDNILMAIEYPDSFTNEDNYKL